jgi:surfeit locus 1 family protein
MSVCQTGGRYHAGFIAEVNMFRFNWKLTIFTLLLLPLLLSLGMWQLDREQDKRAMQARYEQRSVETPVALADIDWSDPDLGWLRIETRGSFDTDRQFLLDNRIFESRVGYEVITPLRTSAGLLLVNRGWIAQGSSRQDLPELPLSGSPVSVNAVFYVPSGEVMMLGSGIEPGTGTWPEVIQRLDLDLMSVMLEEEVLPLTARLETSSPGLLQANWQAINMQPETHRAYAVQWFMMALVLVILYFMFSFRRSEN